MKEILVFGLVVAAGFVASGVVLSFYMLVTRSKSYEPAPKSDFQRVALVGLTIFTGPTMLTGNMMRKTEEPPPRGYVPIMLGVTALWSYLLGLLVVSLALTLPSPF